MENVEPLHGFPHVVAQYRELELVCLREGLVREGVVDAYANYLSVQTIENRHGIPERAHLFRADARERPREEREHRLLAQEVGQGSLFPVLIGELEIR